MKVLIAEDDRFTREGLVEVLEGEGYRVVVAVDGSEAIQLFQQQSPDFVCLDIMMPGRSGYEAFLSIRPQSPEAPLIPITAHSQ